MLAIRLDEATERRLEALAARTGRTKTFYAREAIEAHLDDLEDFYLAEERLRKFREGDAVPSDEETGGDGARADVVDVLRRLWAQGEASGAAIDGNFDPDEIAQAGGARLATARRDD